MENQISFNHQVSRLTNRVMLWTALALLISTGSLRAQAQLTSFNDGTDNVFAVGTTNHLFDLTCIEDGNGACILGNLTGPFLANDVTKTTGGPNPIVLSPLTSFTDAFGDHLFFVDSNHHLNQSSDAHQLDFQTASNTDLGVQSWGGISGYSSAGEFTFASTIFARVFYVSSNQHVHMLVSSNGGPFGDSDLTSRTGNLLALQYSSVTSFHDANGEHVFYSGANQHLYQLYGSWISYYICSPLLGCGQVSYINWVNQDLTLAPTNAPLVAGELSSFSDGTGEHVFYISNDVHIHELQYANGSWSQQDLTLTAGTFPFGGQTGLTSLSNALGEQLFYIGSDLNVHDVFLSSSGGSVENITSSANGPIANPCFGLELTSFTRSTSNQVESEVFYTGNDEMLHRLSQTETAHTVQILGHPFTLWVVGAWTDIEIPFAMPNRCIQ
jgi:hypothetical protein